MTGDRKPCPCCDLLAGDLTPLEALALGVGLSAGPPAGARHVTDLMCEAHQGAFREGVVRMLQKVQRLRQASAGL